MITEVQQLKIVKKLMEGATIRELSKAHSLPYDAVRAVKTVHFGARRNPATVRCIKVGLRAGKGAIEIAEKCGCTTSYVYLVKGKKRKRAEDQEELCHED